MPGPAWRLATAGIAAWPTSLAPWVEAPSPTAAACALVVPAISPARAAPTSIACIVGNLLDFLDMHFSFVSRLARCQAFTLEKLREEGWVVTCRPSHRRRSTSDRGHEMLSRSCC